MKYLGIILLFISGNIFASEYDSSERLQSLFTTPQERSQLDKLRASGKYLPDANVNDTTFVKRTVSVEMQGVLIHGKRRPVAFINDQNTSHSARLENNIHVDVQNLKTSDFSLPIRINNQSVKLRPGQQWDEAKRHIKDNYQIKHSKQKTSGLDTSTNTDIMQE